MLNHFGCVMLRILAYIFGSLLGLSSIFQRFRRKKKAPIITNPILFKSATQLSEMIRQKQVKSEDVMQAYILRCNEANPIINAIVEDRFKSALLEARNADQLIMTTEYTLEELKMRFPLLGVPMTVKESISAKGMSNRAGRVKTKILVADEDAEAVAQLKAAGAIIIAVTNTPELCMCIETFNNITGQTNNPYDTRKTCGGSSGGETALIASGASVIGIGSDIMGSLRIPALFCGVFTHKPTARVVSVVGHVPHCKEEEWKDCFTLGPIARYSEDLLLLMKVMQNPTRPQLSLDTKVSIKGLNYYYMEGDKSGAAKKIDNDMKEALKKIVLHFKNVYQIDVKEAEPKCMSYAFESSLLTFLKIDGIDTIFSDPQDYKKWKSIWPEFLKKMIGCSNSSATNIGYGVLKKISNCVPRGRYEQYAEMQDNLREEFQNLLQSNGVLFYPTQPFTAFYHGDYAKRLLDLTYTMIFNALGFPSTNCPLGLSKSGMPVGIQVVASPGCDHLTLAVARELEKAFGGWVPPPHL